jgi:Arc/MetJ-type ribon-helix-helix transcriptional regulator
MMITLRPEQEDLITEALGTGAYRDAHEVIDRALQMLRSEGDWINLDKDETSARIERALAQFENGEFFSADESRADMARRKAEWLRNHPR